MTRHTLTILVLLGISLVLPAKTAGRQHAVSEKIIMELYIEHPDSCLGLLDKAQAGKIESDLPVFQIDLLRAMCYEIKGDYPTKERCTRRLLEADSVRLVPERKLKVMVMLAGVLDRQNKYEDAVKVCRETVNLARGMGKKKEEAEMLSTLARISYGMKDNRAAQAYFTQAIDLLKNTSDVHEMAFLSTIYGEAMTFLIDTGQRKDAIELGHQREVLIEKMSRLPGPPAGYIDQQYGFLYAKMALLLAEEGRNKEAAATYDKFCKLDFAKTPTGKSFIVPYLLKVGRYADALHNNEAYISAFAGDTVSYDYLGALQNQAEAYRGLKDFKAADSYMQRCYALQDSIYKRESESKAHEYAALFDSQEKELQLTEARAQSQRMTILIVSSATLIVLLLFILWFVVRNLRRTRERNRIDELIAQKEDLRGAYAQSRLSVSDPENQDSIAEHTASQQTDMEKDYKLFMHMDTIIIQKRLFLNPKLTREEILSATGVSKNSLVPILRKYAECSNFNDYINRLRLEYAIKQIKANSLMTIDAIAESSGFNSRSTFYRTFQNVNGMTPSQYIDIQKESHPTKETEHNTDPDAE